MRAKFIGVEGNRGFHHGREYDIKVSERSSGYVVIYEPKVCPYSSWQDFYNNWQPLDGPVV